MTIASEITRLQNDKAAICTAIENKGVTVGNVTLDDYASCIDAIQTGGKSFIYLVVGGGGGGYAGGGGGGDVCHGMLNATQNSYNIVVGSGGGVQGDGTASCLENIVANGGKAGKQTKGGNSGSGCAGASCYCQGGGGGAGARGNGASPTGYRIGGAGGAGYLGYGGGGGGGQCKGGGVATDGGGQGVWDNKAAAAPTNCGGGGGGGLSMYACSSAGACGVVDICYLPDGSSGITSATGGNSCYLCNGFCVHRFTSNGTFTIVS